MWIEDVAVTLGLPIAGIGRAAAGQVIVGAIGAVIDVMHEGRSQSAAGLLIVRAADRLAVAILVG